jgi:phage terminase small subunit
MNLLRRFVIRAAQELGRNPEARAKASQVLEEQVKPRAEQAWREAQPKIENAKLELKRFAQRVRDEYRKGRDGK